MQSTTSVSPNLNVRTVCGGDSTVATAESSAFFGGAAVEGGDLHSDLYTSELSRVVSEGTPGTAGGGESLGEEDDLNAAIEEETRIMMLSDPSMPGFTSSKADGGSSGGVGGAGS